MNTETILTQHHAPTVLPNTEEMREFADNICGMLPTLDAVLFYRLCDGGLLVVVDADTIPSAAQCTLVATMWWMRTLRPHVVIGLLGGGGRRVSTFDGGRTWVGVALEVEVPEGEAVH